MTNLFSVVKIDSTVKFKINKHGDYCTKTGYGIKNVLGQYVSIDGKTPYIPQGGKATCIELVETAQSFLMQDTIHIFPMNA